MNRRLAAGVAAMVDPYYAEFRYRVPETAEAVKAIQQLASETRKRFTENRIRSIRFVADEYDSDGERLVVIRWILDGSKLATRVRRLFERRTRKAGLDGEVVGPVPLTAEQLERFAVSEVASRHGNDWLSAAKWVLLQHYWNRVGSSRGTLPPADGGSDYYLVDAKDVLVRALRGPSPLLESAAKQFRRVLANDAEYERRDSVEVAHHIEAWLAAGRQLRAAGVDTTDPDRLRAAVETLFNGFTTVEFELADAIAEALDGTASLLAATSLAHARARLACESND